jgi:bifunctional DNA-binding transcriptional regulator/antitoxin component of YhaV-PrlF toxin-antitoxin module
MRSTATAVAMNAQGRLTVPAEARKALGLVGEAQFEAEVRDDGLLLRPAVLIPREDAWAYTPEHRAMLARARDDVAHGRVRKLSEDQLRKLADLDE